MGNQTELHREIIVEPLKNKKDALKTGGMRGNLTSCIILFLSLLIELHIHLTDEKTPLCITRPVLIIAFITMVMLEVILAGQLVPLTKSSTSVNQL